MKHLAWLRKNAGLTQAQLATKLGVEMNTVWKWENKKIIPSVESAQKVAKFFDVTTDLLLNGPKSNEIEIRITLEETDTWEVENMDLTTDARDFFSVHIGPHKIGITVVGRFERSEDVDATLEKAKNRILTAMATRDALNAQEKGGLNG